MRTEGLDRVEVDVWGTTWMRWLALGAAIVAAVAAFFSYEGSQHVDLSASPPVNLQGCDWLEPTPWCRVQGPEALREVKTASDLTQIIQDHLWLAASKHEPLALGISISDGVALTAPAMQVPTLEAIEAIPDPIWFEAQARLQPPSKKAELDKTTAEGSKLHDAWSKWRVSFEEAERKRREKAVAALHQQRMERWQQDKQRWDELVLRAQQNRTYAFWAAVTSGVLALLLGGLAWRLRRLRLEVACTRTHLIVDDQRVLLTELPTGARDIRAAVQSMLPPTYRFGHTAGPFFATVERAVRAQHAAEDRSEARDQLMELGADASELDD